MLLVFIAIVYTEAAALITQELRKAMFKRLLQMVRHVQR
jgi:hypothetical protein